MTAAVGCTHLQLRRSTVAHSMTLSDLYTQQVLNNLAMFVQNPDALPFFAFPNQGTTSIQDTGNIGNPGYASGNFSTSPFVLNGSRQTTENWVLVPVSDPGKLGLMRCAYRQAIAQCIGVDKTFTGCPDCRTLRKDFHGPSGSASDKPNENEEQPCLNSACWFRWSCNKHLPKSADRRFVGRYGEVCVWVPLEGRDMLTRLTLWVLDYAVNDAVQFEKRTKTVEMYIDKNGDIVNEGQASQFLRTGVRKITATIPIDLPSGAIADLDKYGEFLQKFGTKGKLDLLKRARDFGDSEDDIKTFSYWKAWKVDDFVKGLGEDEKRRLGAELLWIQGKEVIPGRIPDNDELFRGPGTFQRKGSASAGLQAYEQRLTAASGASPR